MKINIDVGEIILDGVKLSDNQAFELRLALESELSSGSLRYISHERQSSTQIDRTSFGVQPNSSPRQLASGIASSVFGTYASKPVASGE